MDVCIIGAGLLGLSTAYRLAELGCSVCVVDSREGVGLETSFANGSMLHASQATPWNEPGILSAAIKMLGKEDAALLIRAKALPGMLRWGYRFVRESRPQRYAINVSKNARLARYSLETLRQIRTDTNIQYQQNISGTIKLFRSERVFQHALSFTQRFDELRIPYELLELETLIKLEPALAPIKQQLRGGMYFPGDEIGDAFLYCQALHQLCEERGVQFIFNCKIEGFEKRGAGIRAAIHTQGRVEASQFVIAASSYSPLLGRKAGVRLPIQPVKGYSLTVPIGAWQKPPAIAVIDEEMHAAVCPLGSCLRVAGTAEFAGYDNVVTPSRINNLVFLLENLYPEYRRHFNNTEAQSWTGLRPMTPDGVGIMSRTSVENLFINSGHGHLGWTMAPGAGKALADMMVTGRADIDMQDYSLSRFQ